MLKHFANYNLWLLGLNQELDRLEYTGDRAALFQEVHADMTKQRQFHYYLAGAVFVVIVLNFLATQVLFSFLKAPGGTMGLFTIFVAFNASCLVVLVVTLELVKWLQRNHYRNTMWRVLSRQRWPVCPHCGYDLRTLPATHCPECGQPPPPTNNEPAA